MNHRIFRTIRRTSKPLIFSEIDSAPHVFLLVVLTELEPIFFRCQELLLSNVWLVNRSPPAARLLPG